MILLSQPVMTVGLSIVLLGEAPSAAQLIGVGLVIGGIAIATLGGRASVASRQASASPAGP